MVPTGLACQHTGDRRAAGGVRGLRWCGRRHPALERRRRLTVREWPSHQPRAARHGVTHQTSGQTQLASRGERADATHLDRGQPQYNLFEGRTPPESHLAVTGGQYRSVEVTMALCVRLHRAADAAQSRSTNCHHPFMAQPWRVRPILPLVIVFRHFMIDPLIRIRCVK